MDIKVLIATEKQIIIWLLTQISYYIDTNLLYNLLGIFNFFPLKMHWDLLQIFITMCVLFSPLKHQFNVWLTLGYNHLTFEITHHT